METVKITEVQTSGSLDGAHIVVTRPVAGIESLRRVSAENIVSYVTPDMYGAFGDGIHDDAPALQEAMRSGKPVRLTRDLWLYSGVTVVDMDVSLDGGGYTLHADGSAMEGHLNKGAAITIMATPRMGDDTGPVCRYTENAPLYPEFPSYHYHRGYISFRGMNPTPTREVYADYNVRSWDIHSAEIWNLRFVGRNMEVMAGLQLRQMTHCVISNCCFRVEEGHEGGVGILAYQVYDLRVHGYTAENWTAYAHRSSWVVGYGLQAEGDCIVVDSCLFRNCKHGMVFGGAGDFFTTGLIVNNVQVQVKYGPETPSDLYWQAVDCHPAVHRPIFSNIFVMIENEILDDGVNYRETQVTVMEIACPDATIDGMTVSINGQYNRGVLTVGNGCRHLRIENLNAPWCVLYPRGWRLEDRNVNYANYVQEISIFGGLLSSITNADGPVKLVLNDVTLTGDVRKVQTLFANGLRLLPSESASTTFIPMEILGEAWITNSVLCHGKNPAMSKRRPVIVAPEDSLHMVNCLFRKRPECPMFSAPQSHIVNCAEEDLFGLILGVRAEVGGIGDSCELDKNNLY